MQFKIARRVFNKEPRPKKTTLSMSVEMHDRLELLAGKYGYTVPELISAVLDQYLISEAEADVIKWPKDYKP